MVTVKDVARHAQVSLGTVSRVTNGAANVSPEIKRRVEEAIKVLGYFPNNAARSLVRKESNSIAVLMRNLHSPYYCDLIKGIEDTALSIKRNVFFCSLGNDPIYRDQYIHFLTHGISDAIILYGPLFSDQPAIDHLREINFPFLLIENNFQTLPVNQLLINNLEGGAQATAYLIDNGHKKIAHFMGNPNKKVNLDRFNGYMNTMQSHGLLVTDDFLYNIFDDYSAAFRAAQDIMLLPHDIRPTAIFCSNDKIAAHAITGVLDMGYKVPQDISIMGFDNQNKPYAEYCGPHITSIKQPLYQIGADSILTTTDILSGKITQAITKTYETSLVEYDTVAKI